MIVYAIIPARSGSKGVTNKNISLVDGKPLLSYSIIFAKKISSIDRVFCSTDSDLYAKVARQYGAEVPFLRSRIAATDTAMEEDILTDLRKKFADLNIVEPDIVVWLRPTFVFRSLHDVETCINTLKSNPALTATRTVVRSENRLYGIENNALIPRFDNNGKSMIRRQDMPESFKVFSTDVFRFKGNKLDKDFLGDNVFPVVTNSICGMDIDDKFDLEMVKNFIKYSPELVNEYL